MSDVATTLIWNAGVITHPFDSASRVGMALCEVPTAGGNTARYAIPHELVEFAQGFDGRRTTADLARQHCAVYPTRTAAQLESLVDSFLSPRGLLIAPGTARAEAPAARKSTYLLARIPLLPPVLLNPLGRMLAPLFARPGIAALGALIVASQWWFFTTVRPGASLTGVHLTGASAVQVALLVSLGSVVHEIGHATAGIRFGCRNIKVGWGVYWYYSVFYTDLSEAWRLPRMQRAVVDLGGIYFQLLYLVAIAVWYLGTGWTPLLYVFLFSDLEIASYLSPFFRLDGYWLMSDLFGIANLRAQSLVMLRRGLASLPAGGPRRANTRDPWVLGRGASVALGVYAGASVVFFGGVWFAMLRGFGVGLFEHYHETVVRSWAAMLSPDRTVQSVALAAIDVFWRTTAIVGLMMFVVRAIRACARHVLRAGRRVWPAAALRRQSLANEA